ncbi:PAP2 superfamily protein [Myriangium duriaei CBS 260.36]|uniref:PAP2 superfamily protein n=1 Tax=Myriangium duriaei CBS 260.36 TaxID=1168546 RepID=A0A9P4ME43_9PEZI|nr:PAP2 superfamily protein [Myriangium duriaei CBS 260.36]
MPGSESHMPGHKTRNGSFDGGKWGTIRRLWQQSYAADYLGFGILLVFYINMQLFAKPFHRMFYLDDHRIQFPHAEVERVPVPWLFAYAGGLPLVIIAAWLLVSRAHVQKAHITLLGLLVTLILTTFITDVIKNSVGRPRPDLIARCSPARDTPKDVLVGIEVCTETRDHLLHDGWRSFPSGHSSFSFSGLGYLAFFFASQVHAFRPKADLARMLLVLAPFIGAALIAISRLEDYRHDVFDVTIGSLLGLSIAYLTWRRHYPALTSPQCDLPYSLLSDKRRSFTRLRDEEEGLDTARNYGMGSDTE